MTRATGITVTAGNLRRALAAVLPAASTDDTMPNIAGVHLHGGNGVLAATTTNRYVAAHARCDATGTLRQTLIRNEHAQLLLTHLRPIRAVDATVTLKRTGDKVPRLTLDTGFTIVTVPIVTDDPFPLASLSKAFAGAGREMVGGADTPPAGEFNLSQKLIGWLNRILAAVPRGEDAMRWRVHGPLAPIVVEVGEWLVVLLMPMRFPGVKEPVPFGLPKPKRGAK